MPRNRTLQDYIQIANKIHRGRYTYDNTIFSGNKINVTCSLHGEFCVSKVKHIQTRTTPAGCPKCAVEKARERSRAKRMGIESFINRANIIHGTKYDYSKSVYVSNNTKLTIICPRHGEFSQTPSKHIGSNKVTGTGCPYCAKVTSYDLFVEKSQHVHGTELYDYKNFFYKDSITKSEILCNVCDNPFTCSPSNHARGHGCPRCNVSSGVICETLFNRKPSLRAVPGYIYVFRFGEYIKIGITQNEANRRFSRKLQGELLFKIKQPLYVCFVAEQTTLENFKRFKQFNEALHGNGHTECLRGIDPQTVINRVLCNVDKARQSFSHYLEPN